MSSMLSSSRTTENMQTQNSSQHGENSNRAGLHSSDDFSIRGTFDRLSHEKGNFVSNLNEMVDNCLDNGASIIKIILREFKGKYYIGTSSNGIGIDKDVMKSMFRCSDYKSTRPDKHGMFGVGSTRARVFFMGFKGNVLYLSCHKKLTEEEKGDNRFYATNKFAEIEMYMETSYNEDKIDKTDPKNEISRRHEELWNNFSIDPDSTGVVELMEVSKEMFDLTNEQINHTDIEKNLMANIAWTYEFDLKDGKTIMINDDIVGNLPGWRECNQAKKLTNDIASVDKLDEDFTFPEDCDRIVKDKFIVSDNGNKVEMAYKKDKYQKKRVGKKKRKIGETVLQHKATFWCGGDNGLKELIDVFSSWFDEIGVKYNGIESKIYTFIFRDSVVRNNKKIPMEKEVVKKSGDTIQYQCMDNVENLWYIVKKDNDTDRFVGIISDKSHIVLKNVDPDGCLLMRVCKININKKAFFKKFIEPNLPAKKKKTKKKKEVTSDSDTESEVGSDVGSDADSSLIENDTEQVKNDEKLAEGIQVSQQTFQEDNQQVNDEKLAEATQMSVNNIQEDNDEEQDDGQLNVESPVASSNVADNVVEQDDDENNVEEDNEQSNTSTINSRTGTIIPEHTRDSSSGLVETNARLNWFKDNSEKFNEEDKKEIIQTVYPIGNSMITKICGEDDYLFRDLRNRNSANTIYATIETVVDDLLSLYDRYYNVSRHNGENSVEGGSSIMRCHEKMDLHIQNQ